jgi:hypothetical protein
LTILVGKTIEINSENSWEKVNNKIFAKHWDHKFEKHLLPIMSKTLKVLLIIPTLNK